MSSQVCVDASFALKLVLDEEDSAVAQALWASWAAQNVEVIAPCHLIFEATSVIRNHVYRREISAEAGQIAFDAFLAQGIKLLHPGFLEKRAWELWPGSTTDRQPTMPATWRWPRAQAANCGPQMTVCTKLCMTHCCG
jgi:predicted nucleic acid-binding protein